MAGPLLLLPACPAGAAVAGKTVGKDGFVVPRVGWVEIIVGAPVRRRTSVSEVVSPARTETLPDAPEYGALSVTTTA